MTMDDEISKDPTIAINENGLEQIEALKAQLSAKDAQHNALKASQNDTLLRLKTAELKALGLAQGLIDTDALKLIDLSTVEPEQYEATINDLKVQKPYLFQKPVHSSHARPAPPSSPPEPRHALDMSPQEYSEARARFLRR